MNKPKIIVILGPTSSGKSDLAVNFAKKMNGEVVSADSRQVYKGLDIGSGKITKKEQKGVRHHLLDVVDPNKNKQKRFTVNDYQELAYKAIDDILARNKMPIICGGTGFYIQAIVDGIVLPDVDPQMGIRKELDILTTNELFSKLKKVDLNKSKVIDKNNRPRLIRAIEIAMVLGKNRKIIKKPKYDALQIGINYSLPLLKEKIEARLLRRLNLRMIDEVRMLHKKGLSWKRMEELGLEYRYISLYLQDKMTKQEMVETLEIKIYQYAKKQLTWFKRDERIWWVNVK